MFCIGFFFVFFSVDVLTWSFCFSLSLSPPLFPPCLSLFIPLRNQAMRKKLILYFKRRNHARKQWVSRELSLFFLTLCWDSAYDGWLVWNWARRSLKWVPILDRPKRNRAWSVVSSLPVLWGELCFWRTEEILSHCHLEENVDPFFIIFFLKTSVEFTVSHASHRVSLCSRLPKSTTINKAGINGVSSDARASRTF